MDAPAPKRLTTKELADRHGVSTSTVEKWRQRGVGPEYVKIGSLIRYPLDKVEEWEARHTYTTTNQYAA